MRLHQNKKMFDKIQGYEIFYFKLILFFVITFLPVQIVIGCCWLKDPSFIKDPEIVELNDNLIRVQLNNLDNIDCVDHFYVYFWETKNNVLAEERNESQAIHQNPKLLNSTKLFVDIKVKEDTNYTIQVSAYEDGIIDCGDNWSNQLFYKNSKIGNTIFEINPIQCKTKAF